MPAGTARSGAERHRCAEHGTKLGSHGGRGIELRKGARGPAPGFGVLCSVPIRARLSIGNPMAV
jgi:hypothetical protein